MKISSLAFRRAVLSVLLVVIVSLCGCANSSSRAVDVVVFGDVHFTPFYDEDIFQTLVDTPATGWQAVFESSTVVDPQTWGEESYYPLLLRAVQDVCDDAAAAPFAVYVGDVLTHHFDTLFYDAYGEEDETAMHEFALKTVTFFVNLVRAECGAVPVMFSLGNNDSYAGDYQIEPGGAFLSDTVDLMRETLLYDAASSADFDATWQTGGYYVASGIADDLAVIGLNTILFSTNASDDVRAAALTELEWFSETLAEARAEGRKVWIVLHIPPGVDIFSTAANYIDESGDFTDAGMMWQDDYAASFLASLEAYSDVIAGIVSGHTHMDEYRLPLYASTGAAEIGVPAISPLFGNNPAYKVVTVLTDEWLPVDYGSVNAPLDESGQLFSAYYTFSDAYGMGGLLSDALGILYPQLSTSDTKKASYIGYYYSGHNDSNPINDAKWPAYRCGIANMTKVEFLSCAND